MPWYHIHQRELNLLVALSDTPMMVTPNLTNPVGVSTSHLSTHVPGSGLPDILDLARMCEHACVVRAHAWMRDGVVK